MYNNIIAKHGSCNKACNNKCDMRHDFDEFYRRKNTQRLCKNSILITKK